MEEQLNCIEKIIVMYFKKYEALLFRRNKPSTFKTVNDELFTGYIDGITYEGKLQIILEDNICKTFDLKELKLLY